ncbi:zinc transporter ZntB [Gammaproteobacteria bacterium]|jgi:zinc transporter|nr:zinc transporter ZntB [Gammaproteobacteria bacterium]MDA9909399.1 zinc transporter ZntB [Gammaproteobacteria bacterium]
MNDPITNAKCFVHGLTLDGNGTGLSTIDFTDEESPVWLHLDYSESDCVQTLKLLKLPENVIESLIRVNTRPRTIVEKEGFLVFLRAVNLNPGDDPDDMVSVRIWLEKNRLITVRQRRVFSIQDLRKDLEDGKGPKNTKELFITIVERMADRISEYVDAIEEKVGEFEDTIETSNSNKTRVDVSSLRRQSAQVRRYLAPQRDALESFYRLSKNFLDDAQIYELHEQSDRIVRYVEDLDLVRERCLVLQEELMNRIAQEQNARMYVLSIVAAIFLPISFVTGLFGMNVAGLPGIDVPMAFNLVAGGMAVVVIGILSYFKIKKWL